MWTCFLKMKNSLASCPQRPLRPSRHYTICDGPKLCFSHYCQVAAAQAAVDRGDEGAEKRLAAAEDELERALEAVLDAECEINGEWSSEM